MGRAIETVAAERRASLIAMVGGGHGVLYRLVYGSTTDALARTGQHPVWVVTRAML